MRGISQIQQFSSAYTIRPLYIVLYFIGSCISENILKAQLNYKVLFLGNSYTGVNNLPQMIYDVALSAGDTLTFDSHTPGGYQLKDHSLDVTSQNKIKTGGWNYVVIQGQSQEPVLMYSQFIGGGIALHDLIRQYNPCAVTVPYMTWGRKNGDAANCASYPLMCTYQGMDTTIRDRYLNLTASINGEVAPVSVVWNFLRKNHPNINLYQADESHPSVAGSYAAACCFYTILFKKDPSLISFDAGLSPADASNIRNAVKTQVFGKLPLWDFKKKPVAAFSYQIGPGLNEVIFSPKSQGIRQTYYWNFGDGSSSAVSNPSHSYLTNGTYTVSLTTTNCDLQGLHTAFIDTVIQFCNHTPDVYTTSQRLCNYDTLWTQPADTYQWFVNGIPIPETKRYLANYKKYNLSGFSVVSTTNGCSELSVPFTKTPEWSGYYFDALGDPCAGDTVKFAVLHQNGFLSGAEKIFWYKDGLLLSGMGDEDTLLITGSGKYECKVLDPNSDCPSDTTSYLLEYDCGDVGIKEITGKLKWTVFPNPASETISIDFSGQNKKQEIQICDNMGRIVKSLSALGTVSFSIADLADGFYFIRLKNAGGYPFKLIKE